MDENIRLLVEYAINYSDEQELPFEKRNALIKRKTDQNSQFTFNESQVKKIEELNGVLSQKQYATNNQATVYEKKILHKISNKDSFIDDYEIDFNVALFAEKKFEQFEEMDGNPFYQFKALMGFTKHHGGDVNADLNDWYLNTNHNMYQWHKSHPLQHQHHCYLLHYLYDHTILAWQDIIDIEEIWIEIDLKVQNFTHI